MPTSKKVAPPKTRQGARNGGAVAPRKPRRAASNAGTIGTPVGSGGVAGGATTSGPAGGVIAGETATTAETPWGALGWFRLDAEGAKVHFGIDQQEYFLDASAANYNAMYSLLLACWLETRDIQITYGLQRLVPHAPAPADAPRPILSVLSI